MTLIGPTLVVTCILLAISMQPTIVTSVVTSYEKLQRLADKGDDILIKSIEDVINEGQEKIKKLTTLLAQYYKHPKKDYHLEADHPNDFYLMIKHHLNNWYSPYISGDIFPAMEEVIRKRNLSFPIMDDLGDAVLALVRLQYVYKLKAQDMFEGNYLGYMGPALNREDTFWIGRQAFEFGYLPQAQMWLQMNVDLLTDALENDKQDLSQGRESSITVLRQKYLFSLCLLGRTYFYMNDSETARKLYEQCNNPELTYNEEAEELGKELEADNSTKLLEEFAAKISDSDENTSALCSREKDHRVTVLRPHHVCRYKSDPFIPYRRFREEILSTSPYASVFYDIIHDSEIEKLKEIAIKEGLQRGKVGGAGVSDVRTGDLGWVHDDADPLVARVSQRVTAFSRLDVTIRKSARTSAEKMQVVNYGLGGHYDVHMDAFTNLGNTQNRLATVLFYLSDVEKGGATIFPRLGVSVSPVKGMALMWYNYEPHMKDSDLLTHHAGCPVLMGNKWIANKWIWIYGNMFRRPCGPSPQSKQLEVENIVSLDALKQVIE